MAEFYPGCSDSLADFHILVEGARVANVARTPLLHLNAEGRDKTERRGVRGGGEGDGKLETLTMRRGRRRGGADRSRRKTETSRATNFSMKMTIGLVRRKRKGASRFTAMIGSRPCAPERSGRGGAIDTQMPWNYMCDHVIRRARLSLYDADRNTAKRNRTGKRLISLS